jgi:hypothetical protein
MTGPVYVDVRIWARAPAHQPPPTPTGVEVNDIQPPGPINPTPGRSHTGSRLEERRGGLAAGVQVRRDQVDDLRRRNATDNLSDE